jgi:hypothetical protein
MTDTFGLGSLFQEEGPGRTGAPRVLPIIEPTLVKKVDDDRSFGDYFQTDKNLIDRFKEYFEPKQENFGGFQRDDNRVVQFGLPEEFSQTEILRALEDIKSSPTGSTLADRRDVAEVAKRLESLPEDDPIFAGSPLDALAADIDSTLAELNTPPSPSAEEVIDKKMDMDASTPSLTQDKIESAAMAAFNDYLEAARGAGPDAPQVKDLDDYKKQFAEATGIDISGKVDKSHALMTFGLALMQNKAGRGFNVGKMLASVGEAGTAALPALQKAKAQARNDAIAAGKFALESQSADKAAAAAAREKAMNRSKYWVYKKGAAGEEFTNFDEGQFVDLNKYEIDKLINNPNFDKNYDFINASDRMSILAKRAEGIDLGDPWGSYERISLIGGKADDVPPEFQVLAAPADPNFEGTTPTAFKLLETPETIVRRFSEYQESINSGADKFEALLENLNEGISIPNQILSGMQQALRSFGIDAGSMPSNVADAKRMLNNLAIDEATNILQESGKTLSDNDRKLVKDRIGQISWASGDVELIKRQLEDIYDLTVLKPQQNLDRAVSWLEDNAGIKFGGDMPTQAEIDQMNKIYGTSLTMDDFKK